MIDCPRCEITHADAAEAAAMHGATDRCHEWLRGQVALSLEPVRAGKKEIRPFSVMPTVDRKKPASRGYER